MATKKAAGNTELANYDAQLAALAQAGQKTASERAGSGGSFIGTGGGRFKVDGVTLKETELPVVVSDFILENALYTGAYDPDNPQPPVCFAFGREEEEMVPHEDSEDPQGHPSQEEAGQPGGKCETCWAFEWGSASTGKGKACKNAMRLGLISADSISSAEDVAKADVKYLKVPVTSVKAFSKHVKDAGEALHLPVQVITTLVTIEPSPKGGHMLSFAAGERVEDKKVIGALLDKHKVVAKEIDFPYQPATEQEAPARGKGGRQQRQAPAKAAGRAPAKTAAKAPAKGFGTAAGTARSSKY